MHTRVENAPGARRARRYAPPETPPPTSRAATQVPWSTARPAWWGGEAGAAGSASDPRHSGPSRAADAASGRSYPRHRPHARILEGPRPLACPDDSTGLIRAQADGDLDAIKESLVSHADRI